MTTARKPKTDLRVVASKMAGPDLEAMERVLQESTRDMAPMISRTAATRARVIAELKVLEADRDALVARRNLFKSQTDAVFVAFERDEADINSAIQMHRDALGGGGEGQGQ